MYLIYLISRTTEWHLGRGAPMMTAGPELSMMEAE